MGQCLKYVIMGRRPFKQRLAQMLKKEEGEEMVRFAKVKLAPTFKLSAPLPHACRRRFLPPRELRRVSTPVFR